MTAVELTLLIFVGVAAVTDLQEKTIHNWNTYSGIVAGGLLKGMTEGWAGWIDSWQGFGVCGGMMLVCFLCFDMGGGDLKLIAMMGAFLGLERGVEAMLWTFILASIVATALLVWQIGAVRIVMGTARHLWLMVKTMRPLPLTAAERAPLQRWLYLAPAAFAACVMTVWGRQVGTSWL